MGEILVVYFSATGHTKLVAETIAETLGCDLTKIDPVRPYDFDNPVSIIRSVVEQISPFARPQLNNGRIDMSEYDIVILAEPIWLGTIPKAVKTFITENNFSDKVIFNVCTGGSDNGKGNLKAVKKLLPPDAIVADTIKFDEDVTKENVLSWLQEL